MDGTLSIIYFNSRSFYSNFTKIKDYLKQFTMFSVIAVSETWRLKCKIVEQQQ